MYTMQLLDIFCGNIAKHKNLIFQVHSLARGNSLRLQKSLEFLSADLNHLCKPSQFTDSSSSDSIYEIYKIKYQDTQLPMSLRAKFKTTKQVLGLLTGNTVQPINKLMFDIILGNTIKLKKIIFLATSYSYIYSASRVAKVTKRNIKLYTPSR